MTQKKKLIIATAHTKGGVGKSTIAWNLANSFDRDRKLHLVDLDFNQVFHYINLMAGKPFDVHRPLSTDALIEFLDSVPDDDMVLIDVGGFDSHINRMAVKYSTKVLIPLTPDSTTEFLGYRTFSSILSDIDTDAELNIVLNNVHPFARNFEKIRTAISGTNIRLLDTVIRSRKVYKTTLGEGQSVFGDLGTEASRAEIMGVRDELLKNR